MKCGICKKRVTGRSKLKAWRFGPIKLCYNCNYSDKWLDLMLELPPEALKYYKPVYR